MKRFCFLVVLTMVFCAGLMARPVSPDVAELVATNFWTRNAGASVRLVDVSGELGFENIFVFTTSDHEGFVIVAGDDCVTPIIGYSFTNPVRTDSLPVNLTNWLGGTGKYITWLSGQNTEASAVVAREWKSLGSEFAVAKAPAIVNVVNALLQTTWSQGSYYNKLCPSDEGGKCVTGCTATATAQVMKYHNHPATGHGSHSYTWNSTTLSADFENTTYNWANMPAALGSTSTTTQDNAVATLMYHVGVACEMDYGSSGSGAPAISYNSMSYDCAENALRNYFKYDWGIHSIELAYFTDQQWKDILKSELNNSRPVIYTGFDTESGHCFVCDGYNSSDQFHFNWGWGGYYDGFFAIGHLNPGGSGTGGSTSGTYNLDNQAIIGIKPNTNTSASSTLSYGVNNGSYGSVSVTEGSTSMTSYTTETELLATAKEGYRFTGWSDNCLYNPRSFVGNGGMVSVTANFAPCGGDTAYYCNEGYYSGYGSSATQYWGIRIPASQLRANDSLKAVMLYCLEAGSYTLTVYSGGTTAPGTQQMTQTVNLSGEGWKTIPLNSPIRVNNSQPMWIVFNHTGSTYKVAYTYYAGNGDSNWSGGSDGSSWSTLTSKGYHRTFLIKGIFHTDPASTCVLTGNVYPVNAGNVDGAGTYNKGDEATIYALANPGYKFVGWEDGGMDQPRSVTMNGSKSVTANYARIEGDTLSYTATDEYLNAIGTPTAYDIYWAVKFDTMVLKPNRQINAIQLYDVSTSNTSMMIYKGGENAPKTCAKSYSGVTTTASGQYNTYNLPTPYQIDDKEPLWIVFKSDDSSDHPCAYTHYSGNNNGCHISVGSMSAWESLTEEDFYLTWMIKVITADGTGSNVETLSLCAGDVYATGMEVRVRTEGESAEVRIYDSTGRMVRAARQESAEGSYTMPVAGVYYVVIDGTRAVKVVVK